MQAQDDVTPREEHCCAELNDDGTLKLLRLLCAYLDEGVSDAEARKGLMAVAREHLRNHRRWEKQNEDFHKRWRQFKNPKTRPASAQFWLVATLHSSEDEKQTWLHSTLTDFKDKEDRPDDGAVIVSIRQVLQRQLPVSMGPAFDDVAAIRATASGDLEFALRHRSTFLLEAFGDIAIREPRAGGTAIRDPKANLSGTGPFYVTSDADGEIEMRANDRYYRGKPAIDRIVIKPFTSLRSAWAEMLRGRVDVLYDVGLDALDSLASSNDVNVFTVQRSVPHSYRTDGG
jgi:hypothetical protein